MGLLHSKTLLFLFLRFYLINGHKHCPVSSCGSTPYKIKYPFKLHHQKPKNNCTYFNLTCDEIHTNVSLPHGGDFYVQNIDYVGRSIQLYDPENCLMRRMMNFSFESSSFKAIQTENYTFYVCPVGSGSQLMADGVYPIPCLSNSTSITVATGELLGEVMGGYGCRGVGSRVLPVSVQDQFDYDANYDDIFLFLTWDESVCKECPEDGYQDSGPKPIANILAIALSMPALILVALSCCSVFCLYVIKMIGDKHEAESRAAATPVAIPQTTTATVLPPPSTTANTGVDESKITACTEIIVLGDESIPSGNNNTTCSICLENYSKKETIRLISKCGHCFHAICIQQWLGKNSTCPVCRTSLCDVDL